MLKNGHFLEIRKSRICGKNH